MVEVGVSSTAGWSGALRLALALGRRRRRAGLAIVAALAALTACERPGGRASAPAATAPAGAVDAPARERALADWRAQKFGMFIHFGLYSMLGGVWHGERVSKGYSEQIRAHGRIPREAYAALAGQFDPVGWNADSIALLAKAAGMRSIVITAKHHDGFSMYHTRHSDFNVVDATPFGRDVLKELAEACARHDLRLGIYFSLIDWHFPGAAPISEHNSDPIPPEHEALNLAQLDELLTNYGPVSELWFDMGAPTPEQSRRLAALVHRRQPGALVSGRVWNDQGDFNVMGDNFYPGFRMEVPWQTPASMFDETWGYRSWQERGRTEDKVVEKVRSLVRVVSRGGNYLLNIGPAGDGSVVPFEAEVLRGIGRWLAVNGEAIYGTTAGPFDGPEWGDVTARPEAGLLYLHVVDPPDDGVLALPGLESPVVRARPLAGPERDLEVRATAGGPAVVVPGDLERDPAVTVIRVEFSGPLTVRPRNVLRLEVPGAVLLDPARAHSYHSYSGAEYYSTVRTTTRLDWHVEVARTGDYAVDLCYGPAARGRALELALGGQRFQVELSEAEPAASPDVLPSLLPYHARAGPMRLEAGKVHTLSLRLAHPASPHEDLGLAELEVVLRSLGGGG